MIPGNDKNVGYSSPNMIDVAASPGAESPNLPPEIGQSKFYENIHLDIFHGPMDKEDIALVLNNNGEYLIANGFVDIKSKLGVWIKWADQLTFYPVIEDIEQGTCTFNGLVAKPNLTELLAHHDTTQQPITTAPDGPKLMYGIKKQSWELDHKNVKTEKELGSGAFGTVYLGSLFRNGQWIPAAIKVPRLDKAKKEAQTAEFLQEARIQRDYLHVNIVRLFGVATNGPDILIVLEYVNGGDLLSYVKKNPHLNVTMRLAFCFDVASGMAYLHKIQCLHRDMAARNCLVVQSPCYCKITDFGLSAKGLNQAVSKTKSVPIRWIAPEVIKTGTYEAASDVWSLGVMFWEVYTFCKDLPYAKIKELKEVQVQLKSNPNFRPDMAKKAEPPFDEFFNGIFVHEPKERWTAKEVRNRLVPYCMISRFRPETALYKEYFALVGKADARAKRKTQKGGTPKGGAKSPMSRRRSSEKPKSTGLAQKGGPKIKRSSSPHA